MSDTQIMVAFAVLGLCTLAGPIVIYLAFRHEMKKTRQLLRSTDFQLITATDPRLRIVRTTTSD